MLERLALLTPLPMGKGDQGRRMRKQTNWNGMREQTDWNDEEGAEGPDNWNGERLRGSKGSIATGEEQE